MCSITDTQGGAKGFKITSLKSKEVLHRISLLLSLWAIPHPPPRELLAICQGQQELSFSCLQASPHAWVRSCQKLDPFRRIQCGTMALIVRRLHST